MKNIASFTINHLRLNSGLYLSRQDSKDGVTTTTFDLRFVMPNREPAMDVPALHTIEHLGATFLRFDSAIKDDVIYFGPMGCRTGCYLVLFGDLKPEDIFDTIIDMCDYILNFEGEIPGAKPAECGNYSEHNLESAKLFTKQYKIRLLKDRNFVYPENN